MIMFRQPKETPSTIVPQQATPSITERIPVNASGHRLDIYMTLPTSTQWALYKARTNINKLCTSFYLAGSCDMPASCQYDHTPISTDIHYCMQYVLKEVPCPTKGACRRMDCISGHVCQNRACAARGKSAVCKFARNVHGVDTKIADWVEPEDDNGNTETQEDGKENGKGPMESWTLPIPPLIDL